ncbi:MAG: hypothetical protein B6244_01155 [Candidatus Cloacimonetes bacterium 4572_55]|nr:MAG: hypothetical protein B6244_01155 [Candidatus Cloacimonetes bacterium 4572_55]
MKIIRIELNHISVPLEKAYKLAKHYGTVTHADAIIAKVFTDQGIIGLGEADPLSPFTIETPDSVMTAIRDEIAPQILGQDPTQIDSVESQLDTSISGNLMARGAVNMALFDITGKYHNKPAHHFLGELRQKKIPLFIGMGCGTPDEDSVNIRELIAQQYYGIMIKMGAFSIPEEIERMISAKKQFGDKVVLLVDANQGWSEAETLQFLEGIKDFPPDMIEQPIKRGDADALKRIRDQSEIPICADEGVASFEDAKELIHARAVDAFSIKVSKNGGISKSKVITDLSQKNDVKCLMNSMLEFGISQAASLHLACTLPNLIDTGHAYGSTLRMGDRVTDFSNNIAKSIVTVPDAPGLGVALIAEKLEKYTQNVVTIY